MKRNKFSLSHYKLLTMDMGNLIPISWYETLPGDTIQHRTSALVRVSPLLSPVMHPVACRIHHWFVPLRLIWEDFEEFITGGPDGTSTPTHPYIPLTDCSGSESTILDYLGVPPVDYTGDTLAASALPFRAYVKIYNEWYRDQDLVTEVGLSVASGSDGTTSIANQKVAWEKDYFTTARPWEQKGDTVTIPLAGDAEVYPDASKGDLPKFQIGANANQNLTTGTWPAVEAEPTSVSNTDIQWDDPALLADLSSVSGIDINDFRLALAVQRYQEARAKFGSRYVEYLKYCGVKNPSDARLQNPEYLGGGRQIIQFSEVLSTDSGGSDPVGDMKGHGIAAMRTNRFRRFFEEHGIVMTLMSVVPKAIYSSSLYRGFLRDTKESYFQKELQHIGEQEITNREIQTDHSTTSGVFGYQGRYDEYRFIPSTIAGEFRSTNDHWHYSRIFSGDVSLNSSFVTATPTKRVNASSSTDCLYVMANHSIQARRPLAKRSTPRTG